MGMQPTNGDTSSLTTSVSGLLKGSGGRVVVAVAGTDFPGLASANSFSQINTFTSYIVAAPSVGVGIPSAMTSLAGTVNDATMLMFPQSGTNVSCILDITPRGSGDSIVNFFGTDFIADSTNYSILRVGSNRGSSEYFIASQAGGTGTVLPIAIYTGGTNTTQVYLATSGAVGIMGTPTTGVNFHVKAGAFSGNLDNPTYAATISLDVTQGNVHKITTTSAIGNATINASAAGVAGQEITIIITNDSSAGRTITFGSNFKPSGTIVGTASKTATIRFASDGTSWWETSRILGL